MYVYNDEDDDDEVRFDFSGTIVVECMVLVLYPVVESGRLSQKIRYIIHNYTWLHNEMKMNTHRYMCWMLSTFEQAQHDLAPKLS